MDFHAQLSSKNNLCCFFSFELQFAFFNFFCYYKTTERRGSMKVEDILKVLSKSKDNDLGLSQSLSKKDIASILLLQSMFIGIAGIAVESDVVDRIVQVPYQYGMVHTESGAEQYREWIRNNIKVLEAKYPMIDFYPIYEKLKTTHFEYDLQKPVGYHQEENTINVGSLYNTKKDIVNRNLLLGEITLEFVVQNYRGYQEGLDDTLEGNGVKRMLALVLYGDISYYDFPNLFRYFPTSSFLTDYIFADISNLKQSIDSTVYEKEAQDILIQLGKLKRLDYYEEGAHFVAGLQEKNRFILSEIPNTAPYYQKSIQYYDFVLHKKLEPLGIPTTNFDERKLDLKIFLFDSDKYNSDKNSSSYVIGIACHSPNQILLSSKSYLENDVTLHHELTHIASYNCVEENQKIGPFDDGGEFIESYTELINNFLFSFEGKIENSYGGPVGTAYLMYFLGNPYLLTKAFFTNDDALFYEAFQEEIISRQDLGFVLEIFFNNRTYTKEELDRCYQILLKSYIARIVQVRERNIDTVSLGEYASYFNHLMARMHLSGIGSSQWKPSTIQEILQDIYQEKVELKRLDGKEYDYFEALIDPENKLSPVYIKTKKKK